MGFKDLLKAGSWRNHSRLYWAAVCCEMNSGVSPMPSWMLMLKEFINDNCCVAAISKVVACQAKSSLPIKESSPLDRKKGTFAEPHKQNDIRTKSLRLANHVMLHVRMQWRMPCLHMCVLSAHQQ